jgi:microcystin-dependent protein
LKFTTTPLTHQYPKGTILAVASQTVLGFFKEGKGFGEYLGWYLCDGRSGRPDLKGRVLVGHDSYNQDYSLIGNTGGLSHVGLKTGELPEHTHTDSGHSYLKFRMVVNMLIIIKISFRLKLKDLIMMIITTFTESEAFIMIWIIIAGN